MWRRVNIGHVIYLWVDCNQMLCSSIETPFSHKRLPWNRTFPHLSVAVPCLIFSPSPQIEQHYSKPHVKPLEIMPVFPDFDVGPVHFPPLCDTKRGLLTDLKKYTGLDCLLDGVKLSNPLSFLPVSWQTWPHLINDSMLCLHPAPRCLGKTECFNIRRVFTLEQSRRIVITNEKKTTFFSRTLYS